MKRTKFFIQRVFKKFCGELENHWVHKKRSLYTNPDPQLASYIKKYASNYSWKHTNIRMALNSLTLDWRGKPPIQPGITNIHWCKFYGINTGY